MQFLPPYRWYNGYPWSFAYCCGKINALSLSRFDVTIKTFFFHMCRLYVVCQFCFAPECFVTDIAGRLFFCVDAPVVVIKCVFSHELLSTTLQTKSPIILMEYLTFRCFLGDQLTQTDPNITVGFYFEKPINCT